MANQPENQFLVALDGLELSEKQKQSINSGIQEVVMRELAKMDSIGDYNIVKNNNPLLRPFIRGIKWDKNSKSIIIGNKMQQ